MTQEELLTAIDVQILHAPPFALGGYTKLLLALRAVVELHLTDYPCETMEVIKKELANG